MPPNQFSNPWPSFQAVGLKDILDAVSMPRRSELASIDEEEHIPQIQRPDWVDMGKEGARVMWLGHASVYLQFERYLNYKTSRTISVLFDPVFSKR